MGTNLKAIPQKSAHHGERIFRISQKTVEQLPFENSKNEQFHFDSELKGFGVRVSGRTKTYIVQAWVNGKKLRIKIARVDSIKAEAARLKAKEYIGLMAMGVNPKAKKTENTHLSVTLWQVWLEYKSSRDLRPTTQKLYEGVIKRCFSDWLHSPIIRITKDMVQKRSHEIANTRGPHTKKDSNGAEAQANQAMRILRSLINFAAATHERADGTSIITENPVKRLSQAGLWPKVGCRKRHIHKSQLASWFTAVNRLDDEVVRDYLILCILTGLRRSEAASLTWEAIDLDNKKTLTIAAEDAKNGVELVLPLSDYLVQLLKTRKIKCGSNRWVFPGRRKGTHLVESRVGIAAVTKETEIKFTPHDLRRSFLTYAESIDVPYLVIKRLVNHSSKGDVTSDYVIRDPERLRQPMQDITDFVLCQAGLRKQQSDGGPGCLS